MAASIVHAPAPPSVASGPEFVHVNPSQPFAAENNMINNVLQKPQFARKSYHVSRYEVQMDDESSRYTSGQTSRAQSADSRGSAWVRQADALGKFSEEEATRSLFDTLYQRGFQLKGLCRTLDTKETGRVPRQGLRQGIINALKLKPVSFASLDHILDNAQDGTEISTRKLMNVVQAAARADMRNDNRERSRFKAPGIMYGKMQSMLQLTSGDIGLANRRPPHPIGDTAVSPPFGIEGDAERMECIISAYMENRSDEIQLHFHKCDRNNDGKLSYVEFATGMKNFDSEIPKASIEDMIHALDPDGKGFISLRDIRAKFSVEFMKNKSQRGSAGHTCKGDSIIQWPLSQKDFPTKQDLMASTRQRAKNSPRYNPSNTRAEKMRMQAIKAQMSETDPLRAQKMGPQSNLKDPNTMRSELKMSGVLPIIPAPPPDKRRPMTYR